jgi:hypothetical protein
MPTKIIWSAFFLRFEMQAIKLARLKRKSLLLQKKA